MVGGDRTKDVGSLPCDSMNLFIKPLGILLGVNIFEDESHVGLWRVAWRNFVLAEAVLEVSETDSEFEASGKLDIDTHFFSEIDSNSALISS